MPALCTKKALFKGDFVVTYILITIASMRGKGFAIIYHELDDDIKSVLSADDYKQYLEIIKSIYADEYSRKLNKLKF